MCFCSFVCLCFIQIVLYFCHVAVFSYKWSSRFRWPRQRKRTWLTSPFGRKRTRLVSRSENPVHEWRWEVRRQRLCRRGKLRWGRVETRRAGEHPAAVSYQFFEEYACSVLVFVKLMNPPKCHKLYRTSALGCPKENIPCRMNVLKSACIMSSRSFHEPREAHCATWMFGQGAPCCTVPVH